MVFGSNTTPIVVLLTNILLPRGEIWNSVFKHHGKFENSFFCDVLAKFQIQPLRRMMFALKLFCFHSISISCALSFSPFSSDIHIRLDTTSFKSLHKISHEFQRIKFLVLMPKTPQRYTDIEKLRQRSN